MNLLKRMRNIAPAAIAMTVCISAFSLDLPTKKVNGKTCYYYKVSSNETIYGISTKYGISRDDIIKYNPSAADGLKAGQVLYFPVEDFKGNSEVTSTSGVTQHEIAKGETLYGISRKYGVSVDDIIELNPVLKKGFKTGTVIQIPAATTATEGETLVIEEQQIRLHKPATPNEVIYVGGDSDEVANEEAEEAVKPAEARTYTVAVMLPFMLDEEKISKPTNQVTEFYRGFLIAADSLSSPQQKFEVLTYDTKGSLEHVNNLLKSKPEIGNASIIIAPGTQDQLQAIAGYGAKNDIYVLNNFVVKDNTYHTNAYVLQTNATTERMYERAADAFIESIKRDVSTVPVILTNTAGKQDKQAFVNILKQRLAALGISPMTIEYTGNLHATTITEQIGEALPGTRYAFISTSGSLSDFNKYAPGLQKYKETLLNNGSDMMLFGYPEWTTFKSDARDYMHKIGTTIYSRFYADNNSAEIKGFESAFKRWYGKSPADGVPSQAVLGFDTGCYIFTALATNGGDFSNNTDSTWRGAQTTFNFQHETGDSGQVNEAVYIINFKPGNIVETEVL